MVMAIVQSPSVLIHELQHGPRVSGPRLQIDAGAARLPKYETNVTRAIGFHGAIEKELHQHVLLCVAAAKLVLVADGTESASATNVSANRAGRSARYFR
jgi:hypothetical protein